MQRQQGPVFVAPAQPAAPAPVEMPHAEPVTLAPEPQLRSPAMPRPVAPPPSTGRGGGSRLFKIATGISGLMRREMPEASAPQSAPPVVHAPAVRAEPVMQQPPQRPLPPEETGLDIPAFLRRQSN
jgi:hypothetical protein